MPPSMMSNALVTAANLGAIIEGFFLLQALFDLKVQSPLNKKRSYSPSLAKQDTERKPERTTAIPPARIAVLIQRRSKTEATKPTKPKTPKMVKSAANSQPVHNPKKSRTQRASIRYDQTQLEKLPANREKAEIPISKVKPVRHD